MKSILIQQSFEKFLQNCSSTSFDNVITIDIAIGNNLYQTFFKHKPEYCLFSANAISNEVLQFCQDYSNSTNIFFFHQQNTSYEQFRTSINLSNIYHIGYNIGDVILPKLLINDQLFYCSNQNKNDGIICFMDGFDALPNKLLDLLYPNTNMPIKLFNCPNIKHYQNLGILTEKDKASVLQTHKYYLDLKQDTPYNYNTEAIICGALPVSVDDLLDNRYQSLVVSKITETPITYSNFLRDIFKL